MGRLRHLPGLQRAPFIPVGPGTASKTAQVVYDANGKPVGVEIIESNGETEFVPTAPSASAPATPAPAPEVTPPPAPAPTEPAAPSEPAAPTAPEAAPAQPEAAPAPPPAAPPQVNFSYFHDQLAPYGTWIQVGGLGWCWRPDSAIALNPDWRPYYDMGQWVYTDNGWYWASDYAWGDIPFHYGRWVRQGGLGWLWVPDYTWGPSWVMWRQAPADGCIGWAPLPPGALFIGGVMTYRGVAVGANFDFGLGYLDFTFIGYAHFHDDFVRLRNRPYQWDIPHSRIRGFYAHTTLHNDFHRDPSGRMVNEGLGRTQVEHLTQHPVNRAPAAVRNPVGNRAPVSKAPGAGGQPAEDKRVFIPPAGNSSRGAGQPGKADQPGKEGQPGKDKNQQQ
jgi:hypothetical protein